MLLKRCRWFKQNVLWFLCGVCTVIWVLNFISPFRSQHRDHHASEFLDTGNSQNVKVLTSSMASKNFSVIKLTDETWIEDDHVCKTNETFPQATLHTPKGDVNIQIYPPEHDVWVSGYIDREGGWELDLVRVMHDIIQGHPDWIFIDIGANIGVYTVSLAKAGFDVVAIEPLVSNVQRLCRSVIRGMFNATVHVIHNAVSDSRRRVALGKIPGNVGGTYVKERTEGLVSDQLEQTILLDDLAHVFRGKVVVIKMDVENHEDKVIRGAANFFKLVDVRYLLMEFKLGKRSLSSARLVTKFLQDHHMIPVLPTQISTVLDPRKLDEWPTDVMWIKVLNE